MSQPLSIVADQQILSAEAFSAFGELTLIDGRSIDAEKIENADVLFVRSVTKVDKGLLENSPVRFVGSATSGTDHIDLAYLKSAGIHFESAPGSNARSVAEYVLSSLFSIADLQDFVLTDKTVGIIGCGQVGSRLRSFLEALGVTCLVNDPPLARSSNKGAFVELDEVLSADIISLHTPLSIDGEFPTKNLVDSDFLAKLKSDVMLINTSRGEVINEQALLEFKQDNPDSTLVLDVWCNEPDINLDLLQHTLIATPHIAGYSLDGKLKATRKLLNDLITFLNADTTLSDFNLDIQGQCTLELVEDSVQLAVMQSYDVRSDAVALRNLFTMEKEARATFFDDLRKNYPVRREFSNRVIHSGQINSEVAKQLTALGFEMDKT